MGNQGLGQGWLQGQGQQGHQGQGQKGPEGQGPPTGAAAAAAAAQAARQCAQAANAAAAAIGDALRSCRLQLTAHRHTTGIGTVPGQASARKGGHEAFYNSSFRS